MNSIELFPCFKVNSSAFIPVVCKRLALYVLIIYHQFHFFRFLFIIEQLIKQSPVSCFFLKVSLTGIPPVQESALSAGVQLSHLSENPCRVQSRHMFPITSLQTERIHSVRLRQETSADSSLCVLAILVQVRGSLDPDWLQTDGGFG